MIFSIFFCFFVSFLSVDSGSSARLQTAPTHPEQFLHQTGVSSFEPARFIMLRRPKYAVLQRTSTSQVYPMYSAFVCLSHDRGKTKVRHVIVRKKAEKRRTTTLAKNVRKHGEEGQHTDHNKTTCLAGLPSTSVTSGLPACHHNVRTFS